MKSVEDLEVFKEAHKLTMDIYKLTKKFPEEERYGIVSQMKRSAFSVAANLMEGSHRICTASDPFKEKIKIICVDRGTELSGF